MLIIYAYQLIGHLRKKKNEVHINNNNTLDSFNI